MVSGVGALVDCSTNGASVGAAVVVAEGMVVVAVGAGFVEVVGRADAGTARSDVVVAVLHLFRWDALILSPRRW